MAYTFQLTDDTTTIDLYYNLTGGWSLLTGGVKVNEPESVDLWGGRLEDKLTRHDDGRRVIPLELTVQGSDGEDLIDRINALRKLLRQAASYHTEGKWAGYDEVFLDFKINDASYPVRFPVIKGEVDTSKLMEVGREPADIIDSVPVMVICKPYWEADATYTLENYVYNPGFWRGSAPGDSWTEVNGADVTSTLDTSIYEFMGQSLKQVYIVDAVNDTGVISDAITVVAETAYYFEARNYRVTGCDTLTARVYDASNAGVIAASALTFSGDTDEWVKDGVSFTTPAGCVSVQIELYCLSGDSSAGGTAYWDAIYLTPGSTAPTGWMSGRNITNELDAADQINVICVSEIPGEVEAESEWHLTQDTNAIDQVRIAKRTRNTPRDFIWELLGADAVVTAGDAACKDSSLGADANAPGGQTITVSFAGTATWDLRCYWQISSNLASYYGKFVVALLARADGSTDTIKVGIKAYQDVTAWRHGGDIKITAAITGAANYWNIMDGWEKFAFPVGTHDNDNWDTGNQWVIEVWAQTDGTTDSLEIAGAYLIPCDERYFVAAGIVQLASSFLIDVKELDGDRGVFPYSSATNRYYSNWGHIGTFPLLTPESDNWFYFIRGAAVDIDDALSVGLTYRPRGIFLRGTNP